MCIFVLACVAANLLAYGTVFATNPIVTENQLPGSTGWKITNRADDTNLQIKGYGSATSVNLGDTIDFFVTVSPAQTFDIEVFRMGWYGGTGGRLVTTIGSINGVVQPSVTVDPTTGLIVAPWSVSHSLTIPTNWISGIYLAKLTNAAGFENYIVFVVRDDASTADLLYQQSVTTDQAYNNFPNDSVTGKSMYDFSSYGANTIANKPRAVKVSFDRPYDDDGAGLFFRWEYNTIRWLEKSGYHVTYSTNIDTHASGASLLNYKAFLSAGHDEYWTKDMYDATELARDSGVHLAFFGSNAVYWQIRLEDSASGTPNRVVTSYKSVSLDPETDPALETVKFRDTGRAEQGLIGIQYITYNSSSQNTDYVVQNSDNWVYANSGFVDGDTVADIVGYEVDISNPSYALPANSSYTLLSSSPYVGSNGTATNANSVIYQAPSGAWVFGAGTMSWAWALDKSGYLDPRIQQTTQNILDRFAYGVAPVLTNPGNQTGEEADVVLMGVAATDANSDPLTFSAAGLPDGLTIDPATGEIAGTLTYDSSGLHQVTISVTDGIDVVSATFEWLVSNKNRPPSIDTIPQQVSTEDNVVSVAVLATDLDGDTLSYAASNLPSNLTIDSVTGVINGTLAPNDSGNYNVTVTVGDGIDNTSTQFNWIVNDINHTPAIANPSTQNSLEGQSVSLTMLGTDSDDDQLTYTASDLPPGLSIDASTGIISGLASFNSAGSYTTVVTVSDGSLSASTSFTWVVTNSNQPPILTNPAAQQDSEGDSISLLMAASDPDGDPITFSALGLPDGLSINPTSGEIAGTLGATSAGPYNVTVTASDGIDSDNATFAWTVVATNAQPILDNPGPQTNNEGEAITLAMVATDIDGDILTYSASGLPDGLVILPATGVVTGSLTNSSSGATSITVTVDDGSGEANGTSSVTFLWTVNNVNQPPVLTNPGPQVNDSVDAVSLTLQAADPDNDVLVYSALNLPPNVGIDSNSGEISGSLTSQSSGVYSITITVSDSFEIAAESFLWTVNHVNQVPIVSNPGNQVNNEGDVILLDILATDPDGEALDYAATGLPTGLSMDSFSGEIQGTIDASGAGTYAVTVTVGDGIDSGSTSFQWTVNAFNLSPIVTNPGNMASTAGDTISLIVSAGDPDGDSISFAATGLPTSLTINPATGEIAGDLDLGASGTYMVEISVSDSLLATTVSFEWLVGATNQPPVATNPGDQTSSEGESVTLPILATDPNGDSLVYSAAGLPSLLAIDSGTGVIAGTIEPITTAGTYTVNIGVADSEFVSTQSFVWTVLDVNSLPSIIAISEQTNLEGDVVSLLISATDLDGDLLVYSATNLPPGLTINPSTGEIQGQLSSTAAGIFQTSITVNDGISSISESFVWTVTTVNEAPSINSPGLQTDNEGATVTLPISAIDPDNDVITYSAVGLPIGLTIDASSGVISGTVAEDAATAPGINNNTYNVTITVSDGVLTGNLTFDWIINEANLAPILSNPGAQSDTEGNLINLPVAASDPDGDALTYSAVGLPPGLAILPASGLISGTIPVGTAGMYTGTVTASDGALADTVTFVWTVNSASGCVGMVQEAENGTLFGRFAIGTDVNASGGQYIHVPDNTGSSGPNSIHRAEFCFNVPAAGLYRILGWVYAEDGTDDSFYVKVDGAPDNGYRWHIPLNTVYLSAFIGDSDTNTDVVEVELTPGNHTIVFYLREDGARLDRFEVQLATTVNNSPIVTSVGNQVNVEGESVSVTMNASDLDGDAITWTAVNLPAGLSINANSGEISGVPNVPGLYNVIITANDGQGGADSAAFGWTITPSSGCGSLSQEAEAGILFGSFVAVTDGNASGAQYIHVPENTGSQNIGSANRVEYCVTITTPGIYNLAGWVHAANGGSDSFFVTVDGLPAEGYLWDLPLNTIYQQDWLSDRGGADPVGLSLSAGNHTLILYLREDGARLDRFQLELAPSGNTEPIITNPGTQAGTAGTELTLALVAIDDDGDALSYDAAGLPSGLAINSTTGLINGTPNNAGVYTSSVTVDDGNGGTDTVSFSWTIGNAPGNNPPAVLSPGNQLSLVNDAVSLLVNANDPDADILIFSATGLPSGLTINPNTGEISGVVDTVNSYTITVAVNDGRGGTASTSFTWEVNAAGISCGSLIQEAEQGIVSGKFEVGNDPEASDGQYVHVPEGSGNASFGVAHKVEYCFTVTVPGIYRIKGWTYASDGGSNSFFSTINGLPANGYLWDIPQDGIYQTDYLSDRNAADPVEVTLDAGDHLVTIYLREDGGRLDKLALENISTSTNAPPTVVTPADQTGAIDDTISLFISASDLDGDSLTYSAVGLPSGLSIDANSGEIAGIVTSPGIFTVSVSVSDGADSVSTSFNWTVSAASTCSGLIQEAEAGQLSGNFVVGNDAIASGTQYIHVPEGSGNRNLGLVHIAEFCVNVPVSGDYNIIGWVRALNAGSNSFFVTVDGQPTNGYLWDTQVSTGYIEDYVSNRSGADPVSVNLAAGAHTITFHLREDGLQLDKLEVRLATGVAVSTRSLRSTNEWQSRGLIGSVYHLVDGFDDQAAGIAQLEIELIDIETHGQAYQSVVQSGINGEFFFDEMPVGNYLLKINLPDDESAVLEKQIITGVDNMTETNLDVTLLYTFDGESVDDISDGINLSVQIYLPAFLK